KKEKQLYYQQMYSENIVPVKRQPARQPKQYSTDDKPADIIINWHLIVLPMPIAQFPGRRLHQPVKENCEQRGICNKRNNLHPLANNNFSFPEATKHAVLIKLCNNSGAVNNNKPVN